MLRISDMVRRKEISENVSMKKTTMTLTSQDQERINWLNRLLTGEMTVEQVAQMTKKSVRQIYRWKARYRQEGVVAVIHGNRGRRSPHRISDERRAQICQLATGIYAGCNHHHLRDLLEEREGINISRASLRRILQGAGLIQVKPVKQPKHRLRRARYRQEGQLIQIDASPHAWLQERGPRLTLVGGIDDATGKVVGALFREHEDQQGYFLMLRHVLEQYGSPLAVYHDQHTMFPKARRDATQDHSIAEQLQGKRQGTQLGRLFEQLHIVSIAARSPQAKGRIERLWGTFQDRLVSELRIAGASTMEQASAVLTDYLPRFNARFAVPATQEETAWQDASSRGPLDEIFSLHEQRTVNQDNTISYRNHRIQLVPTEHRRSWARTRVEVHEHFQGTIRVFFQGQPIPIRSAPADANQLRTQKPTTSHAGHTTTVPKANHPWRRPFHLSSQR